MKFFLILSSIVIIFVSCNSIRVDKNTVMFYNVENLMDTLDHPEKRDGGFTPDGSKKWTSKRYKNKIQHLGEVFDSLNHREGIPFLIGLSEIENQSVVEDLLSLNKIKSHGIIHYESKDVRGIDLALLYSKKHFTPLNSELFNFKGDISTNRGCLWARGKYGKEALNVLVIHWPSRYGGKKQSDWKRQAASKNTLRLVDSLMNQYPKERWVLMGDFNDTPNDTSLLLLNTYFSNPCEGLRQGSLKYRGDWFLYDQILINGIDLDSVWVGNYPFLIQQKGKFKGYPFRTYAGKHHLGGYSDHLPIFMRLNEK